jgi:hypothetical protein
MSATAETTDPAALIDLRAEFSVAGIKSFLAVLDRDPVGLKPVKARIREIAPEDILSSRVFKGVPNRTGPLHG